MDRNTGPRLLQVLHKLLKPDFKPRNEAHLDSLVEYLTAKIEFVPSCWNNTIQNRLLTTWLKAAIFEWKVSEVYPSSSVLKFSMKISIWMCRKKETFDILLEDNLLFNLISVFSESIDSDVEPLGDVFANLLSSLSDHEPGLQLLLYSSYWKTIMRLGITQSSQGISTSASKCVAKIIQKCASVDEILCKTIVETMMWPFVGRSDRKLEFLELMGRFDTHELISPTLHLIINVLEDLLEYQITMNNTKMLELFSYQNYIGKYVKVLSKTSNNEDFIRDLYKILLILYFSEMHIKMIDTNGKCQSVATPPKKIFELLYNISSNVSLKNTVSLINKCLGYWNMFEKKLPDFLTAEYKSKLSPGIQLAFLLMYNATIHRFKTFKLSFKNHTDDDCVPFQHSKSLKSILPEVWRIYFSWKESSDQNLSLSRGILTLQNLMKSIRQYNISQAICIFQLLIYNLKEISQIIKVRTELMVTSLFTQPDYMTLLFQCIAEFIEYLPYTWDISVEALNILEYIYDFLTHLDWPANITVNGLRLANKAIWNYMSPQMILLMDKEENYSLKPFAPMLSTYLKNPDWTIRECSVSLIETFSAKAISKYTSFSNLLLENDFPSLVLDIAVHDKNPFVRKAALRCLQQTVQVSKCWNTLLMNNILVLSLEMLKTEVDSIVQAEVVLLLKAIYEHQSLSRDISNRIYKVMAHVSLENSDMAVKIQSLHFWRSVINRELTEGGMVDGKFPRTIFSEKNRKIVYLNENTIKKILIRALNQLAMHDCLFIFYVALQNEITSEVYKCAKILISDFVNLLRNYKITSSDFTPTRSIFTTASNSYMNDLEIGAVTLSTSIDFVEYMDFDPLDGFDDIFNEAIPNVYSVPDIFTYNSSETIILDPMQFLTCINIHFQNHDEEIKKVEDFKLLLDEISSEQI